MEREIKFRAWAWERLWIYPSEDKMPDEDSWLIDSLGAVNLPFGDSHIIWMQWTGLQDKNGVDIYEDDIVNCIYSEPELELKKFQVVWDQEYAMFLLKNDIGSGIISHRTIELEVIGNIHENPEYLKP